MVDDSLRGRVKWLNKLAMDTQMSCFFFSAAAAAAASWKDFVVDVPESLNLFSSKKKGESTDDCSKLNLPVEKKEVGWALSTASFLKVIRFERTVVVSLAALCIAYCMLVTTCDMKATLSGTASPSLTSLETAPKSKTENSESHMPQTASSSSLLEAVLHVRTRKRRGNI